MNKQTAMDEQLLQRALAALEKSQKKLAELENARHEPIAVVGMACRFPGDSDSTERFWNNLCNAVDCVGEIPQARWDMQRYYHPEIDMPGKMVMRSGGFITDADAFDADFFGIKAEEARAMDPQQRIILELCWHALESAGIPAKSLAGSDTSVYVGIFNTDYTEAQLRGDNREVIDTYTSSGNNFSIVAGRVSYTLGLRGPSMAVDTACTSSLVATHLACQSLRNRESSLSLVGGVNLVLSPHSSIAVSKMGMLSDQGRCCSFDAGADGFVRSEGGAVLVLKRLTDAERDNDRVLALIRGSAVNQMGRSSTLTAPNRIAQEEVIEKALANARVVAGEVAYIEAHGTGSLLGDAMELQAIGNTYGRDRDRQHPLLLGSVKGNIGHTEAVSGLAGLVKTILALQHNNIPPNIHFNKLNPDVELSKIPASVVLQTSNWPAWAKPRLAAVHSFGFSGSNAHCILQQAEEKNLQGTAVDGPGLLVFSAKNSEALYRLNEAYLRFLTKERQVDIGDICYTAAVGRSHFNHRMAVMADSTEELVARLTSLRNGVAEPEAWYGAAQAKRLKTVFVFADAPEISDLKVFAQYPAYREWVAQCESIMRDIAIGVPLDPAWCELQSFMHQYAMAQLWRALGVNMTMTTGFGVGKYVAACSAGVMTLEDALRLLAAQAAYHRDMLDIARFTALLAETPLEKAKMRLLSAETGRALEQEEMRDPNYWLVQRVDDISVSLEAILKYGPTHLIGVGAQSVLSGHAGKLTNCVLLQISVDTGLALEQFMCLVAQLYISGVEIEWRQFWAEQQHKITDIPLYPFDKQRYWIDLPHHKIGNEQLTT